MSSAFADGLFLRVVTTFATMFFALFDSSFKAFFHAVTSAGENVSQKLISVLQIASIANIRGTINGLFTSFSSATNPGNPATPKPVRMDNAPPLSTPQSELKLTSGCALSYASIVC